MNLENTWFSIFVSYLVLKLKKQINSNVYVYVFVCVSGGEFALHEADQALILSFSYGSSSSEPVVNPVYR